jgi:urea carboxylase
VNTAIKSEISGTIWKILVEQGQLVRKDDPLMILEAMKMEIPLHSPCDGTLAELRVGQGDLVVEGQLVAIVRY